VAPNVISSLRSDRTELIPQVPTVCSYFVLSNEPKDILHVVSLAMIPMIAAYADVASVKFELVSFKPPSVEFEYRQ